MILFSGSKDLTSPGSTCVQNHVHVSEMGQDNPFQLRGWFSEMGIGNHADLHIYHQYGEFYLP
jgi:hypothetical protein